MRQVINVPQQVIDEHSLVAQTYAGYLLGHPVRAARYTTPLPGSVDVDWTKPWVEPNPMPDDCVFCVRLSDDEAVRRVEGFQAAIDKEVLGSKWKHLNAWVASADEADIPVVIYNDVKVNIEMPDGSTKSVRQRNLSAMASDFKNRRKFIEDNQYVPREAALSPSAWGNHRSARPHGWNTKAAPIVSLPLRIKRKMCIDWNHVYLRWMQAEGLQYDFDKQEFYRDVESFGDFDDYGM